MIMNNSSLQFQGPVLCARELVHNGAVTAVILASWRQISDVLDPDFMNTVITGDESWVYGYDPEPVTFLTMKIRQEHLNTTLLKCCLPSTNAIDRREKTQACI